MFVGQLSCSAAAASNQTRALWVTSSCGPMGRSRCPSWTSPSWTSGSASRRCGRRWRALCRSNPATASPGGVSSASTWSARPHVLMSSRPHVLTTALMCHFEPIPPILPECSVGSGYVTDTITSYSLQRKEHHKHYGVIVRSLGRRWEWETHHLWITRATKSEKHGCSCLTTRIQNFLF